MPYIITITAYEPAARPTKPGKQTRRAVATLDEARSAVESEAIAGSAENFYSGAYPRINAAIANLPEHGGTVGPLPDGTVIEVAQIAYSSLGGMVGLRASGLPTDAEIIDAYNAAQS